MSTTENKINYGLKKVYYAKITEESETGTEYATPVAIPGAVNASLKKNYERTAIPADDDPEYAVAVDNKGYDGEFEFTNLPQSFYTDCLGFEVDESTIKESADGKPCPFALLFEMDGDQQKRRHVFYRCMATPPDLDTATKGDRMEAKTTKISISATPAKDTRIIKRTTITEDGQVYSKWFETVQTSGGTVVGS